MDIDVTGLNETLLELKRYEASLYKTIRKELVDATKPLVAKVAAGFPLKPLENWRSSGARSAKVYKLKDGKVRKSVNFPTYDGGKARKGVDAIAGGDRSMRRSQHQILRVRQMNAGGAVYDSAGSVSGQASRFVANIDKHLSVKSAGGRWRSRVLFMGVKRNEMIIEGAVRGVIKKYDDLITRKLSRG